LLVVRELTFPEPILDLRILAIPLFDVSVVIILIMMLVVFGLNLLNPLFFQELLGYSSWKSGLAVLPRGLGTLVGMFLIGQLSRRAIDVRWLIGVGFVFLSCALWSMSRWTLGVGIPEVRWAMILSGFGSGLIFPAMSAATLACVSRERIGYASSLYNMMRNTGSAIGISLVTNMLNTREQLHQSYLTEHVTAFQSWRLDQSAPLLMPGAPHPSLMQGVLIHQPTGFGMVYASVQQQASLLAYNDIYRILAMTAACFIPAFLLLKKSARSPGAAAH
jgi:DHA2 family multidrug resistance protein